MDYFTKTLIPGGCHWCNCRHRVDEHHEFVAAETPQQAVEVVRAMRPKAEVIEIYEDANECFTWFMPLLRWEAGSDVAVVIAGTER